MKTHEFPLLLILLMPIFLQAQVKLRIPTQESPIEDLDLSVNRINYLHQYFPQLDGNGLIASIKEYRFDSLDLDLLGKLIPSSSSTARTENHSTQMATILGGRGNSFITGKGVAPEAWLSSTSFLNLSPEPLSYYEQAGIRVQNHSYGLGIENFYGLEAREYDDLVYNNPSLLQVFSAGNMGESTSDEGLYQGIPNYANLTGTFKMAKNVLTVGAVNDSLRVEERSSRGPAYDGRIKPELVAYGEDGTSGSAAIVSGVGILLQQAYLEQQGSFPSVALLRSILINSADDLLNPGPDFISGYGNLNARRALQLLLAKQYWEATISTDTSLTFEIEVPENIHQLKITLAWTDPAAEIDQETALVNDLDLELSNSDQIWHPWVLNAQPDSLALQKNATRAPDHLNNQEQISVNLPKAGKYQLKIMSNQLSAITQNFALSYRLDTLEQFIFTYPAREEQLEADQSHFIRWDYTGEHETAQLWYLDGNTPNWQLIQQDIDLRLGWYKWKSPNRSTPAQFRIDFTEKQVLSDTFLVHPILKADLGYDCGNRLLLEWNPLAGVETYQVFKLSGDRMELEALVKDTFYEALVLEKEPNVFSVAPIIDSQYLGQRSLALQTRLRNQVCYFSNFSGLILGADGFLEIELSTLHRVKSLQLRKWDGEQYQVIQSYPITGFQYFYKDEQLQKGPNFYQVLLELEGSDEVIRSSTNLFYVPLDEVLLYPNPILSGQLLEISLPTFKDRRIQVSDALGRLVLDYDFLSEYDVLETQNWTAGVYFYQVVNEIGQREHQGKIVVR
jgi:hypothetical protein